MSTVTKVYIVYWLFLILWFVFNGVVGYLIGSTKDRQIEGVCLGAFFSFIGWFLVLLMPYGGSRCVKCKAGLPADASLCKFCGVRQQWEGPSEPRKVKQIRKRLSRDVGEENLYISLMKKKLKNQDFPMIEVSYISNEVYANKSYPKDWSTRSIVQDFQTVLREKYADR